MRLYLVRHGQTEWNLQERVQGHSDIELDEMGLRQAELLARSFEGVKADRLITSDLQRCLQTAATIARVTGLEPSVVPALRERCFGCFEGQPYSLVRSTLDSKAEQVGGEPLDHCPEGGESVLDVWNRITHLANELRFDEKRTILVSHGGTMGLLVANLIGAGPQSARAFRFTNASVTELFLRADGTWAIERLNDRTHLEVAREGTSP